MKLAEFCDNITINERNIIKNDHTVGSRIMCPEYSADTIDIKSFPIPKEDIFILCWTMNQYGSFYATIKPYNQPFAYFSTFQSGEKTQYHTHDYIELAFVVEGEFKQKILAKDILFKKGELCLSDKNCPHQDYLISQNSTILFIGLSNEIFDKFMVDHIEEEKILNFLHTALMKQKGIQQFLHFRPKDPEDHKLEDLLLNLLSELECNDEASKYICKGLIIRILHYISNVYDFQLSNEQRKKMNWMVFEEITKYIEEHCADITIKELVAKFHFNEDYYNRILKEKAGMTYSEYVQDIRLNNAYKLLITSSFTIEAIAEKVGYNNKGYFYKIFVQKFGVTPAKLKKSLKR
jgi:AraC-like DNA-binding protein